jgi:uncharacterized protein (DUF983 family)
MGIRNIGRILTRGVRLRCPRCGEGLLFAGFFSMHTQCSYCALTFEREQGYFVGAIYVNYAATTLIAIAGFLALDYFASLSLSQQLLLWGSFAIGFPLFFFRYSRSLWLSIDYLFNPAELTASNNLSVLRRKSDQ